jgi:hypothetical protein
LAVELANNECKAKFSVAPFNSKSYQIYFDGGWWRWGTLELVGEGGYSAVVSFDARGEHQHVEVIVSTDAITPPSRTRGQPD